MYVGIHHIAQGPVDHAMPGQPVMAGEAIRSDSNPEMTAAITGARMTHVQVGFIDDLQRFGRHFAFQQRPDLRNPLPAHGITCLNGLTSTEIQAPDSR